MTEARFSLEFDGPFSGVLKFEDGQPPPGNGAEIPKMVPIPIIWKAKGTSNHPQIGNGDLTGYGRIVGGVAELDIYLRIGSTTNFGDGSSYYYFLPNNESFWPKPLSEDPHHGAGAVRAWTGGQELWSGAAWWSGPGGTPNLGIRITFSEHGEFSRSKPETWENGDKLQFSMRYRVALA